MAVQRKKEVDNSGENFHEKICFVISPIGEPESEIRKFADKVFNHIITPSLNGYKPIRADHISEPGIITTQIIQHIANAPLVIADLSGRNPNVFYELAIRHALRKPLIQLIKKGEVPPFDVAASRIISFDITDLDSVAEAKKNIESQLEVIEKGKDSFDNPISVSMDLQKLKGSDNPEERSLADVIEALKELRNGVSNVENKLIRVDKFLVPEFFNSMTILANQALSSKLYTPKMDQIFRLFDLINRLKDLVFSKKLETKKGGMEIWSLELLPLVDQIYSIFIRTFEIEIEFKRLK